MAFTQRVENYGNHFWLMYENDKLIAFVDGFVTDESDLTDEMFPFASYSNDDTPPSLLVKVRICPFKS